MDDRRGAPRQADQPTITIANEFAEVHIRKVFTRNGERLEIDAFRRNSRIQLDAVELESLSWQSHDAISKLLAASIGPEGEPFDSPSDEQ